MDADAKPHLDLETLATDLSQAITRFRRAMQRSARANFDSEALSPTEVELLLLVAEHPGIGVAAAASELGAAPNTVSTLIRKLVGLGLLRREFSRGDRRVARLLLSDEATGRLELWRERRADVLTDVLGQLDASQQQFLREAVPLLEGLSVALYQPRRRTKPAAGNPSSETESPADTNGGHSQSSRGAVDWSAKGPSGGFDANPGRGLRQGGEHLQDRQPSTEPGSMTNRNGVDHLDGQASPPTAPAEPRPEGAASSEPAYVSGAARPR